MKKILTVMCIMVSGLLCTACINNIAIQELNRIGKDYLEKGDYDNAIARFKSGVDLDDKIFESRYNLGVAYVSKEDYKNAVEQLKRALEINPESKDAAYSLAVALESMGFAFEKKKDEKDMPIKPTDEEVRQGVDMLKEALDCYDKYLEIDPNAKDAQTVKTHIENLENEIKRIYTEYKINEVEVVSVE